MIEHFYIDPRFLMLTLWGLCTFIGACIGYATGKDEQ
jgi:hypothetical protein